MSKKDDQQVVLDNHYELTNSYPWPKDDGETKKSCLSILGVIVLCIGLLLSLL